MLDEGITALEALGIAIRSEIDAQELFKELAEMTDYDLLKERFLNLYQEERRHQMLLEKKYHEMFPHVELSLPPSQLPKEMSDSNYRRYITVKDVLRMVLEQEKDIREFFLDCAETATDLSGKRMFRFLADMKFSHQMILAAELDMIEKYPAYYQGQSSWEVETTLKKGPPAEGTRRHDR